MEFSAIHRLGGPQLAWRGGSVRDSANRVTGLATQLKRGGLHYLVSQLRRCGRRTKHLKMKRQEFVRQVGCRKKRGTTQGRLNRTPTPRLRSVKSIH